jgi:L-asparaginase/Glu-tRNA(Gln) amidotransferase subunit D
MLAFDTDVYVIVADVADPATAEPLGADGFVNLIAAIVAVAESDMTGDAVVAPFLVL